MFNADVTAHTQAPVNGHQVIKLPQSVAILCYSGRARGVCALQSSCLKVDLDIEGLRYIASRNKINCSKYTHP